jgi:hypothetical protein
VDGHGNLVEHGELPYAHAWRSFNMEMYLNSELAHQESLANSFKQA